MHREPLLRLLADYKRSKPDEAPVVAKIRTLVESHTDCFDRTCRPGHITGSAWVVSHDGTRHLLLHHRKLDRWLQPGGHADGDANVAQVALREAIEESGIQHLRLVQETPLDVDVHLIPARYAKDGPLIEEAHEHHDIRFLVQAEGDDPIIVSDESHDVQWFTPEQVTIQTDEESVLRLLKKALTTGFSDIFSAS